ncbi:Sin3 associated polypeptide p18-domain-containing protein [Neohortaea acidophila]|uniref:Sin3 associated polypeptide p18-domain-containing protein n=1 Tax=Neohortaea acidophila TaxID=245834 RepID=A0A6A6PZH2_9PEZI|nr:Sin3 associated polypeptide p18-domain-containing protein [Neohortaea acidophila]KAF2485608.1 Sin3 associated polypeptide p18-domain-containing protein [Neohortaea acidophila]
MSLQPSAATKVDRTSTTPFLLRLFWRQSRALEPYEFSVTPPADTSNITDYTSLLPSSIRQQSVQIYTWPTCTLAELTGLLTSVLPEGVLPTPAVGTRLVYRLVFPDTRSVNGDSGRGRWIDRVLGSVVVGGAREAVSDAVMDVEGEDAAANGDGKHNLEGDAEKTLADARFVIGDYVVCTIYPPTADGRVAPLPPARGAREPYAPPRGGPRENGFGPPRGGGGYRGRGGGGGFGAPPPRGEWRRGQRLPDYDVGGGYRGGGRPY